MKSRSAHAIRSCLVVDDHEVSRRFTVAALRRIAGVVKQTGSGFRAMRLALDEFPDVIVLDVHLRAMNGLTLAARLRKAWPADRRQPRIVILSGMTPDRLEGASETDAAEAFLVKPVSARRLRAAVLGGTASPPGETENAARPGLAELFRTELETRFPSLDQAISRRDLDSAEEILHQLIASAAICRAPQLERRLRALDSACREELGTRELAHRYYALVTSVRGYLASPRTAPAR
jgi:CheY-like chemotaxis protein